MKILQTAAIFLLLACLDQATLYAQLMNILGTQVLCGKGKKVNLLLEKLMYVTVILFFAFGSSFNSPQGFKLLVQLIESQPSFTSPMWSEDLPDTQRQRQVSPLHFSDGVFSLPLN